MKIPRCPVCGKKLKQAYDKIAKKKTKYSWKLTCQCASKELRLSIG